MESRVRGPARRTSLLGRAGECALLDGLVRDIRRGQSRSLLLVGEAGIGKSALLEYLIETAPDVMVVRAAGVESEMELAYAGLHQICAPLLGSLDRLPAPQREALEIVFGLSAGGPPDRFLVGLAVLGVLSEASERRPVLAVIDDAQWLDQSSALTLAFVARRLLAEPVGLVFAARESGEVLSHLPRVDVAGLPDGAARSLLSSAVGFGLDDQVRDRIIAETGGNPLALVELPRDLSGAELLGFGTAIVSGGSERVEESFRRRFRALPPDTQRLLLIAAADPLGEPMVVWRAAELQGIGVAAALPAAEEGLCEFGARVQFRHPLVRAAAYRAVTPGERQRAHAAIAEATNPEADPDRRAWHRALASAGPDDSVADELARSVDRARARGGPAAAAAFLQRSANLTLDEGLRSARAVAAAEAKHLAGFAEDALQLVVVAERGPINELQRARIQVLRGQVAMMQRRGNDAPPLLLDAARRLERFEGQLARDTYRDAFGAAYFSGELARGTGLREVAAAVLSARPRHEPASVMDQLLEAAALIVDAGYAVGAPVARRALAAYRAAEVPLELELRWSWLACRLAHGTWDDEAWDAVSARTVDVVRRAGVVALVPMTIAMRIGWELFAGELMVAAGRLPEHDAVAEAIGGERAPTARIALAAFRGDPAAVSQLDGATTAGAIARGEGQWVAARHWSTAVLFNGLGRYDEALAAAQQGAGHEPDMGLTVWALPELVEAAVRSGRPEMTFDAVSRLGEMARACNTDWIRGVEARARALVAERSAAEELYREAIERLSRTRLRSELARAQLLYGEWLRREQRRVDARAQLRTAHEQFVSFGMEAFAERAQKELLATGQRVRKRTAETRDDLTAQERQIAELARAGLSNPEIGARLFLSARTVEWHLRKVFVKLGIRSRRELVSALPYSNTEPALR